MFPELVNIGTVSRLHGYQGAIKVHLPDGIRLKKIKGSVFIEFAHKPVPFFCLSVSQSEDNLILQLEKVNTEVLAKDFIGRQVWLPAEWVGKNRNSFIPDEWLDFEVFNQDNTKIGLAGRIHDYNQYVLEVKTPKGEALVPVNDETLIRADRKNRTITLFIPEGLLDLYLEP